MSKRDFVPCAIVTFHMALWLAMGMQLAYERWIRCSLCVCRMVHNSPPLSLMLCISHCFHMQYLKKNEGFVLVFFVNPNTTVGPYCVLYLKGMFVRKIREPKQFNF